MKKQIHAHLNLAERIVDTLENRFNILGFRFGLDPILGILPGFGDIFAFGLAAYIIWIGFRLGLPGEKVTRMVMNAVLDLVIGAVPFLGDIGDFAFRSNSMNLKIIREHVGEDTIEGQLIT